MLIEASMTYCAIVIRSFPYLLLINFNLLKVFFLSLIFIFIFFIYIYSLVPDYHGISFSLETFFRILIVLLILFEFESKESLDGQHNTSVPCNFLVITKIKILAKTQHILYYMQLIYFHFDLCCGNKTERIRRLF